MMASSGTWRPVAPGDNFAGSINCDRTKMYFQYDPLQWCWAHLKRDFQALIHSSEKQLKRLGHDPMRKTKELFGEYTKCRDGPITHATLKRNLRPIRKQVERFLLRGFGTAARGMCQELFHHKAHLWTLLSDSRVAPTNNVAERSLRHGVIWRKLSFGTNSQRGDRYVETMLNIIKTCRQQNRSVVAFVNHALQNQPQPNFASLLNSP
ncbi:MAG: transposase [Planctomycetaceae bacterium]